MNKNLVKNFILRPLSSTWESAYRLRRSMYEYGLLKKNYFKVPIISIGNISFGGTGKTPLTVWLINKLESYGLEVMVLTRGYKGKLEHKSGMIKGGQRFLSNPHEYGDEPLLISRQMKRGSVVVGKKRSENLRHYFPILKPDVVLLDDGFQHIQLYRSLNLVLFDALLPLESYQTAPLGYLREGLSALKDADAILISRSDMVAEEQLENLLDLIRKYHRPDIPVAKLAYKPQAIVDCFDQEIMELEDLKGKRVLALTAIAAPESFYNLIESFGAEIVEKKVYPDHYFFTHDDINEILIESARLNAIVISSEKDMVKLRKVTKDPRILSLNIEVKFMSGEDEVLDQIRHILNLDYN